MTDVQKIPESFRQIQITGPAWFWMFGAFPYRCHAYLFIPKKCWNQTFGLGRGGLAVDFDNINSLRKRVY